MKKFDKPLILSLIFSYIPVLLYLNLYALLPAQIPSKFDFSGNISGYTSRGGYLFLTLMPFFMTIILEIAPRLDPKKQNFEKSLPYYRKFQFIMVLFMDIIISMTMLQSIYDNMPKVSNVVPVLLGFLFLMIGNYLPKTKQTFSFGIKTPWTLSSELVWYKTHRIGGYSFVFAGICSFISAFCPFPLKGGLLMFGIIVSTLVPSAMSYVYYKQEHS